MSSSMCAACFYIYRMMVCCVGFNGKHHTGCGGGGEIIGGGKICLMSGNDLSAKRIGTI